MSSLPATLRRTSFTCGKCAAYSGGRVRVPSFSACRSLSCTLPLASIICSALRKSKIDVDSSKRSEEHTSELQSLMRISYAVFCLKKKKYNKIKMTSDIHKY